MSPLHSSENAIEHVFDILFVDGKSMTSTDECVNINLWNFICLSKIKLNNGRLRERRSYDEFFIIKGD